MLLQPPAEKAGLFPQPAARWHPTKHHLIPSEREGSRERGRAPTGAWDTASVTPERELLTKKEKKNNFLVVYKKSPFLRSICLNQLSFVPSADELIKITFCIKSGR